MFLYEIVRVSGTWARRALRTRRLPTNPSSTLEATQGQIDGLFSQLPYKYHQNRVASVGDRRKIRPQVASMVPPILTV